MKFNVMQFLHEVKVELSKVEWPTFSEFVGAAIVVLIVVVAFAVFLGTVDRTVSWLIKHIFIYST